MKKAASILLLLSLAFTLCACGSQSNDGAKSAAPAGYYYEDEACESAPTAMRSAGFGANALYDAGAEESVSGAESETPSERPDKIIYSADVTVESTAFDESLAKLEALIAEVGGWVESSSVSGSNYSELSRGYANTRRASYTLRIPSERFEALMHSLSDLGNVPYTYLYTENVSAQYYDVEARLSACQTQEKRLLEMMESAESVEDIILLEDRLSELRYQIESLQSSLRNWDRRVSYSTVNLELREVREYTPETPVTIRYGERLARAWKNGLGAVGEFFRDFLLWFVEALPTLVLLAVLALVLLPLGKKLHRRAKARRAAKKAAKQEGK